MKFLYLLAFFTASTPALAEIQIVSEGTVDLNSLFDNIKEHKVDPAKYGIPAKLLHTYTIRMSATFEEGLVAEAARVFVPANYACGGGNDPGMECYQTEAHTEVTLDFRSPGAKEVHELIDDVTKQVIGRSELPLVLHLTDSYRPGADEHLAGEQEMPLYLYERNTPMLGGGEFHLLPGDKAHMHLSGGSDDLQERVEHGKLEIERLDADHYRLKAIRLDEQTVRRSSRSSTPMLVVGPPRYDYGLYVRGVGETFITTYERTLKKFTAN